MPVLDRYIVRSIGAAVTMVMLALLVLLAVFMFINEQGWVGAGQYGQLQALRHVAFNLPAQLLKFLPVGALVGALIALGGLARHSELTVFRAAGVSIARIACSVLLAGLVLLPPAVAVGEFLAPPLARMARVSRAIERNGDISLAGRGGAWVRDGGRILRVGGQAAAGQPGAIWVFELSGNHLEGVGRATRASERPDQGWDLTDYAWSKLAPTAVVFGVDARHPLATRVSPAFFGLMSADPEDLSWREQWRTISYLDANGQDARRYRFALWAGVARLAAVPLAGLLSLPFLLGSMRTAAAGARASFGLLLGLGYFILQRMVESGTIAFGLNPVLLAWLPTALLAAMLAVLFARLRKV